MKNLFKKGVILLTVTLMLVSQSYAQNASVEAAVQKLQFALTVEWDQKDIAFRNQALTSFLKEIRSLEKSGLSREEISSAMKASVLDARTASDLDRLIALAKDKTLSTEQVDRVILNQLEHHATAGASYRGDTFEIVIASLFVGFLVFAIVMYATQPPADVMVHINSQEYWDNFGKFEYWDCEYNSYSRDYACYMTAAAAAQYQN